MLWVDYDAYVLDPIAVAPEQMDGVRKKNASYFLNSLEDLQQTYEDNLEYYYRSKFNLDSNDVEAIKGNFHIKFKNFELNYQAKDILRNMIKLAVSQLICGKDCSVALNSSNLELNVENFLLRFKSESAIKIDVVHNSRTKTYEAMKDFVEQFLGRCGIYCNYPPEIKHLLKSLSESDGWYQDVTQHFSLWSAKNRRYFIMHLASKCEREEFGNQIKTEIEIMSSKYDYRLYISRDKSNILFKKLQYPGNDKTFPYFSDSFSAYGLLSFIRNTTWHLELVTPEAAFTKISESFPYLFFWLHEAIKQTTECRKFYPLD